MKHTRADYDRIQDPAGLIPEDEPVFLLRAQDALAILALQRYAELAQANKVDTRIIEATRLQIARFFEWSQNHTTKLPDMPNA